MVISVGAVVILPSPHSLLFTQSLLCKTAEEGCPGLRERERAMPCDLCYILACTCTCMYTSVLLGCTTLICMYQPV